MNYTIGDKKAIKGWMVTLKQMVEMQDHMVVSSNLQERKMLHATTIN